MITFSFSDKVINKVIPNSRIVDYFFTKVDKFVVFCGYIFLKVDKLYQPNKVDFGSLFSPFQAKNVFWSIWFTVFKNHDEVRAAMIDAFPGTAKNCFDPDNHYEPIDRNPDNPNDPV